MRKTADCSLYSRFYWHQQECKERCLGQSVRDHESIRPPDFVSLLQIALSWADLLAKKGRLLPQQNDTHHSSL